MLSIQNVAKAYDNLPVLKDVSLDVDDGMIAAVVGPSGCGKSTLLNIISGIEKANAGKVTGAEKPAAYVFQDDRLLPWSNVYQNIAIVRNQEDHDRIMELIDQVGLKGFENYLPAKLSGGMKKRCGIARAFYYDSELLLMDEPFTGLDYYLKEDIMALLLRMWRKKRPSVLLVTHDIDEALTLADRIAVMTKGSGRIDKVIDLPRDKERDLMAPELLKVKKEILEQIKKGKKEN